MNLAEIQFIKQLNSPILPNYVVHYAGVLVVIDVNFGQKSTYYATLIYKISQLAEIQLYGHCWVNRGKLKMACLATARPDEITLHYKPGMIWLEEISKQYCWTTLQNKVFEMLTQQHEINR